MKPLLLVPAPDKELLLTALESGADGAYAPVKGLCNVRFRAEHFDRDTLREVHKFACIHNKQIYPVINGRPGEMELPAYQAMIEFCLEEKFPGIVLGDWGLIRYWGARFAGSESQLIASGMAGAINRSSVEFFRDMGVARVILPRLQSYSELKNIISGVTDVAYEVFMSGSLCPLYEGRGCFLRTLLPAYRRGVCFIYPKELIPIEYKGEAYWGMGDVPLFIEKPDHPLPLCAIPLDCQDAAGAPQRIPLAKPLYQSNLPYLEAIIALGVEALKVIPFQPTTESYQSQTALWRRLIDQMTSSEGYQLTDADLRECRAGLRVSFTLLGKGETE